METRSTPEVQAGWDEFQARLAAGDVEYVDPSVLDDLLPPVDETAFHAEEFTEHDIDFLTASGILPESVRAFAGFTEHASRAIQSLLVEMRRVGAGDDGNVGNAAHTYGWHLSANRLRGTGHGSDYSLQGVLNNPITDAAAACAQDVIMNWRGARQWVAWLFRELAAGRLPHMTELIGSIDGKTAMYAAASTGWRMVRYTGSGHVDWAHVAHGRAFCNITTWGKELLGKFDANGLTAVQEGDDMNQSLVALAGGRVALVTRGTDRRIYRRILRTDGTLVDDWQLLGNFVAGSGVDACTRTGDDLWVTCLDSKDPSVLVISTPNAETLDGLQVQDLGGAGVGGAPGITAIGNDVFLSVAGTAPHRGEIYAKWWDGDTRTWTDWVIQGGVAG